MNKVVDSPISENYRTIVFGCLFFVMLSYGLGYAFYSEFDRFVYFINSAACLVAAVVCAGSLLFLFLNKLESRLPNYLALSIVFSFSFSVLFLCTGFLLALIARPMPQVVAIFLGLFGCAYIVFSIYRSIYIVKSLIPVSHEKKSIFSIKGSKTVLLKSRIDDLDGSLKKYPFKFIEVIATIFPLIAFFGLAMVGGLYNLTPYPGLAVRLFFVVISFLLLPMLILMMTYGVYINYIFPKKIFGSDWKNIWREIE